MMLPSVLFVQNAIQGARTQDGVAIVGRRLRISIKGIVDLTMKVVADANSWLSARPLHVFVAGAILEVC